MEEKTGPVVVPISKNAINLAELRNRLGPDVVFIEVMGKTVGIKRPSRQSYSRFRQFLLDDSKKHLANELLVADCIVYPEDSVAREALYDEYPALIDTFASEAAKLAGAGAEAKKL